MYSTKVRVELISMEGLVFDSVINYMDKFGPEILVIQTGFLVILSTIFLWLWFSNRRKYHNLKHAIPANIVKSYLDSIIQNSTSLKSQLFRGGGLDVSGVPSVISLQNLGGGESVALSGAPSTALLEELNQKKAQIAALEGQVSSSQVSQRELEGKLGQTTNNLNAADSKIKELEALLRNAGSSTGGGGGNDAALKSQLNSVTKERDDLRDRLREFEIIADDLANLKRLQQENEQLKRSLSAQGQPIPQAVPAAAPISQPQTDVSSLFEEEALPEAPASDSANALDDFLSEPATMQAFDNFEQTPAAAPAAEMPSMDDALSLLLFRTHRPSHALWGTKVHSQPLREFFDKNF